MMWKKYPISSRLNEHFRLPHTFLAAHCSQSSIGPAVVDSTQMKLYMEGPMGSEKPSTQQLRHLAEAPHPISK
jgi:hypothetical protein